MTTLSPAQAVADAARAVEEAWTADPHRHGLPLGSAMRDWLAARRAARDAGYVEVLVSREAVEALRVSHESIFNAEEACKLLARDLAAVVKEP